MVSGRRAAFDSTLYYQIGMPVICFASAVLGFLEPHEAWRWGALPICGQFFWLLLTQGPGNLLPLGVIAFSPLAVPSIISARVGAFVGRRRGAAMHP